MRDPEEVWRLGLRLYDLGMAAAETLRPPGAVREQAARLRSLAATATPAVAEELRELAEALDAEVEGGARNSLAEAEELVGSVWAGVGGATPEESAFREELALQRLTSLREADPEHDRPLGVLAEWVRLRRDRR
ncbi:MAG: hypothetical protein J2P43_15750 [Candidatus Dormibacteraeota bacterium]|nr:hypothetical protein [Candidatus Dormibacteraeota bacterium]